MLASLPRRLSCCKLYFDDSEFGKRLSSNLICRLRHKFPDTERGDVLFSLFVDRANTFISLQMNPWRWKFLQHCTSTACCTANLLNVQYTFRLDKAEKSCGKIHTVTYYVLRNIRLAPPWREIIVKYIPITVLHLN